VESAISTAVVYMTIAGAGVLSQVLVRLHFQTEVRDFAINVLQNPALVVAFLFGVFIVLGMFLDPTVIIAMFAPTVLAIGNALGFDPIHFGVLMVIIMQLGAITPPVGTFLFISCGVAKLPMEKSIKPLLPYIATVALIVIIGFLVPQIVTWLPGIIYG
jgi:C4-dicarboxylate transporter DctM subunit